MCTALDPAARATSAGVPAKAKLSVLKTLLPLVTHTSAVAWYWPMASSIPRSRSSRAPPIATLPYTARAAIAAKATERVVIALSSAIATVTAGLRLRLVTYGSTRTAPVNTAGIKHRVASAKITPPTIVSEGAKATSAPTSTIVEDADRGSTQDCALEHQLAAAAGFAEDRVGGTPGAQVEHRRDRGQQGR